MPKLETEIKNQKHQSQLIKVQPVFPNPPTLPNPNFNLGHPIFNTKDNILFLQKHTIKANK